LNWFYFLWQPTPQSTRIANTHLSYLKQITMKPFRGNRYLLPIGTALLFTIACKHDPGVLPTTIKKWENIGLSAKNEIPAPAGKSEEGDLTLELLSDNSLKYEFHIHNLSPGDAITGAHVHFADAGNNGPVIIDLKPSVISGGASGIVSNLRQGQIDTLINQTVYFNVHSTQAPGGIARGQLDKKVEFAMDVALSGANEVPAVTTSASGVCILRMTEDKILFSKISVSNLDAGDTIRVAHIHKAAAGSNGPVRVTLAGNIGEFDIMKTTTLVDSVYNMIKTEPMYVNAHSKLKGGGLVRGQIR
jgi:hypothetical protein